MKCTSNGEIPCTTTKSPNKRIKNYKSLSIDQKIDYLDNDKKKEERNCKNINEYILSSPRHLTQDDNKYLTENNMLLSIPQNVAYHPSQVSVSPITPCSFDLSRRQKFRNLRNNAFISNRNEDDSCYSNPGTADFTNNRTISPIVQRAYPYFTSCNETDNTPSYSSSSLNNSSASIGETFNSILENTVTSAKRLKYSFFKLINEPKNENRTMHYVESTDNNNIYFQLPSSPSKTKRKNMNPLKSKRSSNSKYIECHKGTLSFLRRINSSNYVKRSRVFLTRYFTMVNTGVVSTFLFGLIVVILIHTRMNERRITLEHSRMILRSIKFHPTEFYNERSLFNSVFEYSNNPKTSIVIRRRAGGFGLLYHRKKGDRKLGQIMNTRGLGRLDHNLYNGPKQGRDGFPRLFSIGSSHEKIKHHTKRIIERFPAVVTDNTQLYGLLDSSDEALSSMEIRAPYTDGKCVPMKEWQIAYYPSCNSMHEMDLTHLLNNDKGGIFGTKGFWRFAWKIDLPDNETFVLKTLRYNHNFEDAHFEHNRVDAMALERLTSSPNVINIYGFCAHSVLNEYADGPRLGTIADKSKKKPLKRLEMARDIVSALADVHSIDGDNNATFVHLDINPGNVVVVGKSLKLNDFNIGIMQKWNLTSNNQCGFPSQYPNAQWRSPEEANQSQFLTEKVDIFSLGHIFFRIICGHEPWNKLEINGRPTAQEINIKTQAGILPHIPDFILKSKDPEVKVILDVMLKCYTFDPLKRPSAREVFNLLNETLSKLLSSIDKNM